jgi:hypothetical protein
MATAAKRGAAKPAAKRPARPAAAPPPVDPRFAAVAAAFARDREVTRRKMFSSENVLAVNGRIFAMLTRGQFVAKLPKPRVDEIVAAGQGVYFDPGHGRLMKQWVALAGRQGSWVALAQEAHAFVAAERASR